MLRKKKWLPFGILFFCLTNCATPPDIFVFENLTQHMSVDPKSGHTLMVASPTCYKQIKEPECGHGVSVVTGREVFIGDISGHWFNNKSWSQIKNESILIPAKESYAPLSAYIIDQCKKSNCSSDVDKFKIKLDSLNGIAGALSHP